VTDLGGDPRRWKALGVVLCASFMVLLDISIVNVAIPSIQANLHASYGQIQFVLAGYALAYAVMLITGGRLGDILGRKRMFIAGVIGFTLASALCGLAQDPVQLISARVLQGLMASVMYPQVLSVIQVMFTPRERGAAFGILGGVIGVATISGPLVGGLLLRINVLDLGWRPIFLVNVPVGIGAALAAWRLLAESRSDSAPRLDIPGVILAAGALFLLTYPLVEGRDAGWPAWAFACLIASVPAIALFVGYEVWLGRRPGSSPLIDRTLFEERAFLLGGLVSFLFLMGVPAFFLTFSLYLQIGLGFEPLQAGLITVPFALCSAIGSGASVRLAPRVGRKLLNVGTALLALGMLLLMLTVHLNGPSLAAYTLIPALALSGLGMGCTVAPLVNIVLADIKPRAAGSASGVLFTAQQVGGAVGVAVVGIFFFGLLGSHASASAQVAHPRLDRDLTALRAPEPIGSAIRGGVPASFDLCFHDRANASDPGAVPPTCVPPRVDPKLEAACPQCREGIGGAIATAAKEARADDFSYALEKTLWFEVAVFAATCLLLFLLPEPPASRLRRPAPPAEA
jgi:EmrB/QacA subfamily drug resistance transporter